MQTQSEAGASRQRGQVIWFDDGKGYGFIRPEAGGEDVFVHYSGIVLEEKRRRLQHEQIVEFEVVDSPKGLMAINVKPTLPNSSLKEGER